MSHSKFSVIIFDLDDTLINTTDQITAPSLRETLTWLRNQKGLDIDTKVFFDSRKKYFSNETKSGFLKREVLSTGASEALADEAVEHYYFCTRNKKIIIQNSVIQTLSHLCVYHDLFLVTHGDPQKQFTKVESLPIKRFFKSILFVDSSVTDSKSDAFFEILRATKVEAQKVLCVGNRLDQEIANGKDLGFYTCRVLKGESIWAVPHKNNEFPDYTIHEIHETKDICHLNPISPRV